jgi:hypothetical protein
MVPHGRRLVVAASKGNMEWTFRGTHRPPNSDGVAQLYEVLRAVSQPILASPKSDDNRLINAFVGANDSRMVTAEQSFRPRITITA